MTIETMNQQGIPMSSVTTNSNQTSPAQLASDSLLNSADTSGAVSSTAQLKDILHRHLAEDLPAINQTMTSQLRSNSPLVAEMVDHVSRYKGKQLRPILLMLTYRMARESQSTAKSIQTTRFDHEPDTAARMLAAAVEMIHLATLVHDDVIDEAETRRHVATVHRRWDTEASVLLGDFLFSRAFHLSALTGDASSCALIGRATDRTCEGELNQVAARLEASNSELDYFRIIRGKTGQLFGLSCRLGARAAGVSADLQSAATRFGLRLGLAFQIADDVLDLTQTTDATGKDAANDIHNGRRTLPILRALKSATDRERRELEGLIADGSSTSVAKLRQHSCLKRGIQSAFQTAEQLAHRACRDLQRFSVSADRNLLEAVARFAVRRRS